MNSRQADAMLLDADALNQAWEAAYVARAGASLWQDSPVPLMPYVMERLREAGARTIVDAGCGDGRNIVALAREGFRCAGADVSVTALRAASARLAAVELRAFLIESDVVSLPFAPGSVDAVTCFDSFSHFVDPVAALDRIRRVLRPGGVLIANVFNTDDSEWGNGELVAGDIYSYRGTMFRFYRQPELLSLLGDWRVLDFHTETWEDPPHGEFRPNRHTHSSYVFTAAPD